jgi:hypothetical protein
MYVEWLLEAIGWVRFYYTPTGRYEEVKAHLEVCAAACARRLTTVCV